MILILLCSSEAVKRREKGRVKECYGEKEKEKARASTANLRTKLFRNLKFSTSIPFLELTTFPVIFMVGGLCPWSCSKALEREWKKVVGQDQNFFP